MSSEESEVLETLTGLKKTPGPPIDITKQRNECQARKNTVKDVAMKLGLDAKALKKMFEVYKA